MTLSARGAAETGAGGGLQRLLLWGAGLLLSAVVLFAAAYGQQRLAAMLVLAPLLEESVFRAGLQEGLLRRWPDLPLLANAVTAAAFSLAHVLVRGDAAAFAVVMPALLIGVIYQRTLSVTACASMHAAMNGLWLALASRGLQL